MLVSWFCCYIMDVVYYGDSNFVDDLIGNVGFIDVFM